MTGGGNAADGLRDLVGDVRSRWSLRCATCGMLLVNHGQDARGTYYKM